MEFDLDKNCTLDLSPNTVLPSSRICHKDFFRAKEGFTEINFRRCCSASSCKKVPLGHVGKEGNAELKRGSIYQSSKEVRKVKKTGIVEGRRKIELARDSDNSFSFRIVDSLCNIEEESPQETYDQLVSVESNSKSASTQKPTLESCSSDGFIEFCLGADNKYIAKREKQSVETFKKVNKRNMSFGCEPVISHLDNGNDLVENDTVCNLHKSLSAKIEATFSPSSSEGDQLSRASSRTRFSPVRKMFNPFMKSKSLRSPSDYAAEARNVKTTRADNMRRNQTTRKSLLHEFTLLSQHSELDTQCVKKKYIQSPLASSPVHLHGCLKLGAKHGVPFFEFSVNQPEETFLAKTWKTDNAFNWVYTFHTIGDRKKNNSNDSSLIAQMQVSCYVCTEIQDGGVIHNSMVTEFVLYDIAHSGHNVSLQRAPDDHKTSVCSSPGLPMGCNESDDGPNVVRLKDHLNIASDSDEFESPNRSTPWLPADEIAAMVIQVPFKKRESLKYRRWDKVGGKRNLNLLNLSMIEESKSKIKDSRSQEKVKVIIPTGNHGLPCAKTRGPSSLLDRWRMGGGCDCGGWDMACPLVVFGNPGINPYEDQPLVDSKHPLELFLQGAKENTPALTMTANEGGYAVDFHAKLSALQAFFICVAILHGTETSAAAAAAGEAQSESLSQSNSVKILIEEEVETIPPSYLINPPSSPIARV